MVVVVALERACAGGSIVRNRSLGGIVPRNHVNVKTDQSVAGQPGGRTWHSMGGMTHRARKTSVHVNRVLAEAGIGKDIREVVTLCTE